MSECPDVKTYNDGSTQSGTYMATVGVKGLNRLERGFFLHHDWSIWHLYGNLGTKSPSNNVLYARAMLLDPSSHPHSWFRFSV